jgi:hypothetical protein
MKKKKKAKIKRTDKKQSERFKEAARNIDMSAHEFDKILSALAVRKPKEK